MYRSMSLKVYIERLPLLAGGRLFSYREQLKKKKKLIQMLCSKAAWSCQVKEGESG